MFPEGRFATPLPLLAVAAACLAGSAAAVALDLEYRGEAPASPFAPKVEVRHFPNRTVEEYRVNGNLYMIKITPRHGLPYYLVDDTGSGDLEMRRDAAGRDRIVPRWTLMTW